MKYSFLEKNSNYHINQYNNESLEYNEVDKNEGLKDFVRNISKGIRSMNPVSTMRYLAGSDDKDVLANEIYNNIRSINKIIKNNEEGITIIKDALSRYYYIVEELKNISKACNRIEDNKGNNDELIDNLLKIDHAISEIEKMAGHHGAKNISELTTFYKNAMKSIMDGMGKSNFKKLQSELYDIKEKCKILLKDKKSSDKDDKNNNIDFEDDKNNNIATAETLPKSNNIKRKDSISSDNNVKTNKSNSSKVNKSVTKKVSKTKDKSQATSISNKTSVSSSQQNTKQNTNNQTDIHKKATVAVNNTNNTQTTTNDTAIKNNQPNKVNKKIQKISEDNPIAVSS